MLSWFRCASSRTRPRTGRMKQLLWVTFIRTLRMAIVADASENAFAGLSSSERKSKWQQRVLFVGSQHFVRRFTHALYNNEREDNHTGSHGPSHDGIIREYQRAWAYQERLLSPRKLYFGAYELGWE
ncbi:hypothetical protein F5Y07DRAFT_396641 [Xylaria sp. FL0933]|nr:hypothetical protein F5Y07DRAFT_396641 [Xylaria sp. FL0933]